MKRNTLNYVVDALTALLLIAIVATGLLVRWIMPAGSGHHLSLLDMNRHGWGDIHFYLAVAMGALVIVHLLLHWHWVCTITARLLRSDATKMGRPMRTVMGLAALLLLAAIIGGLLWLADANIVELPGGQGEGGGGGFRGGR